MTNKTFRNEAISIETSSHPRRRNNVANTNVSQKQIQEPEIGKHNCSSLHFILVLTAYNHVQMCMVAIVVAYCCLVPNPVTEKHSYGH